MGQWTPVSRGSVSRVFALVTGEGHSPAHSGIRRVVLVWGSLCQHVKREASRFIPSISPRCRNAMPVTSSA